MIGKITELIARNWVKKDIIKSEDFELYHYGLFVVLSNLWLMTFCLILGAVFKIALSSIVFFVSFFIVRRFAGGLHARTELHCQILSLSYLFFSIVTIKYLSEYMNDSFIISIVLVCITLLVLFSPADTPQKPLSISERKMFKKIIFFVSIAFFAIICILLKFNAQIYANAIGCAFSLEAILVILGRMWNRRLIEE